MIPKIIHYTWFSGDPFPEKLQNCINSWKEHMPEYEFRLWDMAAVKQIDSVYLKESLKEKVWACASDYVRLYAVYYFGGIYLDTDVYIYKSFDIKDGLDYFENRHFVASDNPRFSKPLRYDRVHLPYIQAEIARLYGYDWKPSVQYLQKCNYELEIYPSIFFDPDGDSEKSYCKHLAVGGWRVNKASEPIYNLKYKITWRFLWIFKWILKKAGYMTIKID